jgi:hypothetical protein
MKILEYEYEGGEEETWKFDRVKLGKVNLFVGDSATGKSRLLNTLSNLGRFVAAREFKSGSWQIVPEHSGITYTWSIRTENGSMSRSQGLSSAKNCGSTMVIKGSCW